MVSRSAGKSRGTGHHAPVGYVRGHWWSILRLSQKNLTSVGRALRTFPEKSCKNCCSQISFSWQIKSEKYTCSTFHLTVETPCKSLHISESWNWAVLARINSFAYISRPWILWHLNSEFQKFLQYWHPWNLIRCLETDGKTKEIFLFNNSHWCNLTFKVHWLIIRFLPLLF